MLNNFNCGSFVFNSSFDSGNLHRVELQKNPVDFYDKIQNVINPQNASSSTSCASSAAENGGSQSSTKEPKKIDVEFNLWTKPDCFGTPYENGNRTWFFFSIRGGEKNQNVRLNIMNLNKQAKLFSQGMHPVIRHGLYGKWERMKEKPSFYVTDENFVLSIIHRTFENVDDNLTFYAFTFPYTYTEQLEALENYDKKFEKPEEVLDIIVRELNTTKKDKLVIDMSQDLTANDECLEENSKENFAMTEDANDEVPTLNYQNLLLNSKMSKDLEDTSESMQQLSSLVDSVQIEKTAQDPFISYFTSNVRSKIDEFREDIYYYRELLISSYENRRIDLLTISSFQGVEERREERQTNLFPDASKPRAHCFRDKKIIFISSRVHPGETPASFVLNGFLNLLLDRKSQVAAILRKMYVFKIVPFLNPDGVYNGLYRSDTLGHNLNRVYLAPRLDTQPSIYAVRKLIRYYHYGFDKPDNVDEIGQPIEEDEEFQTNENDDSTLVEDTCEVPQFLDLELPLSDDENEGELSPTNNKNDEDTNNDTPIDQNTRESSPINLPLDSTANVVNVNQEIKVSLQPKRAAQPMPPNYSNERKLKPSTVSFDKVKDNSANAGVKIVNKEKKSSGKSASKLATTKNHHHYKHFISHLNNEKHQKAANQQYFNSTQYSTCNISMEYRTKTDENGEKCVAEENSNLFLYLDLHGHASKKGVFMYGNHLPNLLEAVEVMLLPKLMSLNSHHFAFDACNFSERNMYLKGKRDGLSKEGSGRVAVYKSTGLIKSYTLESNYNTSKCVNILPPKGKEVSCKVHNMIPPKFTPSIFEEVGRALGPSLLDLTNSNPRSRIQNSEYRSLQGLRNALRHEINRNQSKARVSKFSKQNKKRQTTQSLPSTSSALEISKENKLSTSSNSSQNGTQLKSKFPGNKIASGSKSVLGKVQAFAKKDVNVLNSSNKKKKVLCDASSSLSSVQSSAVVNVNQIPRKKIKVSNGSNGSGNGNSSTQASAADFFMATSKTIDDEMTPCCSKSIPAFLSKAPTSPASSTSSNSTNGGQVKITSFMPIKKHAKTKKLKAAQFQAKTRIGGNKLKKLKVEDSQCASSQLSLESCASQTSLSPASISQSSKLLKKKKLKPLKSLKKRSQKPLLH